MIPFKIPKYIGMPYHGLATNGVLPTGAGNKTISHSSIWGSCKVVRHPMAPGNNRIQSQLDHDAALGLEWRDYALLTTGHAVNGSEEVLGSGKWLYCDGLGNTWVVGVEFQPGSVSTEINIEFWLYGIFGRFGRLYETDDKLLETLIWSPQIPSWYSGIYTAADVVPHVQLLDSSIDFIHDGSSAFINLFVTTGQTIAKDVYPEALPLFYLDDPYDPNGIPMISVLQASISGDGDIENHGNGIIGNLIENARYEDDLVLSRQKWVNDQLGDNTSYVSAGSVPAAPSGSVQGDSSTTWISVYTLNLQGEQSGYFNRTGSEYNVILYRSTRGDISRRWSGYISSEWQDSYPTTTVTDTYDLINDPAGGANPLTFNYGSAFYENWYAQGCSVTQNIERIRDGQSVTHISFEVSLFGSVIFAHEYEEIDGSQVRDCMSLPSVNGPPSQQYYCPGRPACPNAGTTNYELIQLDGQTIDAASRIWHEVRIMGANMFYVVAQLPVVPDALSFNMTESVIGLSDLHNVSIIWSMDTANTGGEPGFAMPNTRELVWSYQPVTEEFSHASTILLQSHTGILYQYV